MPTDRRDLRRRLFALISEQAGYFTAKQAKDIGYSYQAQAYHVAAGNWRRIDRGIFRRTEWVPDLHDDLARWTLWSRGVGVVSHESALAVYDVGEFESARVHLTAPPSFAKRDDAVVIHRDTLPRADVADHTSFHTTTPLRTLVDIAAVATDEDQLARAIDEAVGRGLLTVRQLRGRAEALDARAALYVERAIQQAQAS